MYKRQQKARYDFEATRRQAVQAARQYYTGVTSGLARIQALEAGEKSSRAAVEANRTGYEVGAVSYTHLEAIRHAERLSVGSGHGPVHHFHAWW